MYMCRRAGGSIGFGSNNYSSFDPRFQALQTPEDGLRDIQESIRVDTLKRGNAAGYVLHMYASVLSMLFIACGGP